MAGLMGHDIPKPQRAARQRIEKSVCCIKYQIAKIRKKIVGQYVAWAIDRMT